MAITINGSGTILGISVGGLPDDSVDEGSLANSINTSIAAKLPLSGGTVTGNLLVADGANVGIGKTPQAWNSGLHAINLGATGVITGGDTNWGGYLEIGSGYYRDSGGYKLTRAEPAVQIEFNDDAGAIKLRTGATGSANSAVTWSTGLHMLLGGGINLATSAPRTQSRITSDDYGMRSARSSQMTKTFHVTDAMTTNGSIVIDVNTYSTNAACSMVKIQLFGYDNAYLDYIHGSYWGTNWAGPHNNSVIRNVNNRYSVAFNTNPTNGHLVFTITANASVYHAVGTVTVQVGGSSANTNCSINITSSLT